MRAKLVMHGTPPMVFSKRILNAVKNVELAMIELGEETAEYMRDVIIRNTKRQPASGTLANSIQAHRDPNGSVGVGMISVLPVYWHVINYGAKISGEPFVPGGGKTVRGDFGGARPDGSFQGINGGAGDRMNYPGRFGVKAFKVITAKNYISKTANWLDSYWGTYMRSRTKIST